MSAPLSDRIVSGCVLCLGCALCPQGASRAQGAPHAQPRLVLQPPLKRGCCRKVWRGETGVVPSLGLPCRTDNASRNRRTPTSRAVISAAAGQRNNRCGSAPMERANRANTSATAGRLCVPRALSCTVQAHIRRRRPRRSLRVDRPAENMSGFLKD